MTKILDQIAAFLFLHGPADYRWQKPKWFWAWVGWRVGDAVIERDMWNGGQHE